MRRSRLPLLCLLLSFTAGTTAAQHARLDRPDGFFFSSQIPASYTTLGGGEGAFGGGIEVRSAYAVSKRLAFYAGFSATHLSLDPPSGTVDESSRAPVLSGVDLGVQMVLAEPTPALELYTDLAVGHRSLTSWAATRDLSGAGLSAGVGMRHRMTPHLSLDGGLSTAFTELNADAAYAGHPPLRRTLRSYSLRGGMIFHVF